MLTSQSSAKIRQTQLKPNDKEIILINGISPDKPIASIGTVDFVSNIEQSKLTNKFHVVSSQTNIPWDGLIGDDFLRSQKAQIDYKECNIRLNCLPNPLKIYNRNAEANILQPRSETVIEDNILNKGLTEGTTPDIKICDGVFLAKAIVKVNSIIQ